MVTSANAASDYYIGFVIAFSAIYEWYDDEEIHALVITDISNTKDIHTYIPSVVVSTVKEISSC